MAVKIQRTAPPQTEPITLGDAKAHMRVQVSVEDTLIEGLIEAAREHVEEVLSRSLITQTWQLNLDDFPGTPWYGHPWAEYLNYWHNPILLPRPPLQSVTEIKYIDVDGSEKVLDPSVYRVDTASEPARVTEEESQYWPTPETVINAVTIKYVAGYGDGPDDVPRPIRQAMLLLIAHWYNHREAVNVGSSISTYPMAVDALLQPYRVML